MDKKPKITYVIVTWNNEKEIEDCINSVRDNTDLGFEIIVLDNNSSDRTAEIIEKNFPEVNLIKSQENLGFAQGNNVALSQVNSEYVCFLNPDTILIENIAVPSIEKLKENHKIGIVGCRLCNADRTWQQSCFKYAHGIELFLEIMHLSRLFQPYNNGNRNIYPDWIIGAEMIMRTSEAKRVGGFSTEYYMYTEDMDLCKKVQVVLKKRVYFIAEKSLIHLGGASEIQNVSYDKQLKMTQGKMLFNEKYYGLDSRRKAKIWMLMGYRLRSAMVKLLYWRNDRCIQIKKNMNAIKCILET